MPIRSSIAYVLVVSLIAPLASAQKRKLRKRGPVTCTATGKKVVTNARIVGGKFGVRALGACKIVVRNSEIVASDYGVLNSGTGVIELINTTVRSPKVAIANTGTGVIRLRGSTVIGGEASVELTGLGTIKAKNTVFRGRKIHVGGGRFELDRETRWEKGGPVVVDDPPDAPDVSDKKLEPHRAIRCEKRQEITLANVSIRGPIAVAASGSCTLRLRDSEIIGTQTGLVASGGAKIELVNVDIRSPKGLAASISGGARLDITGGEISGRRAYVLAGGARVNAKKITVRGRGTKGRSAQFNDLGGNRFLKR